MHANVQFTFKTAALGTLYLFIIFIYKIYFQGAILVNELIFISYKTDNFAITVLDIQMAISFQFLIFELLGHTVHSLLLIHAFSSQKKLI